MKEEYKAIIKKLSEEHHIPYVVIATISLNESGCDPNVKPYLEKTWTYFTDRKGKPLGLHGTTYEVQERAAALLGDAEYEFQIHAHGAFQCVGSVLREIGYAPDEFTKDFYTQGTFAMKHLGRMRDRFFGRYHKEPSNEQLWGMYNGGFGAVDENGYENYVMGYIKKSLENRKLV